MVFKSPLFIIHHEITLNPVKSIKTAYVVFKSLYINHQTNPFK